MLKDLNMRLTKMLNRDKYRYKELKQILCTFTDEQYGLTKEIDTKTEFKAIWEYHNTPFAAINLKFTGGNPTFSFEPYGYLTRYGFSGKLTEKYDWDTQSSTDVIVYFYTAHPDKYSEPLQKAPAILRQEIQILRKKIDEYLLLVKGIKEIKAHIPYDTNVTCDNLTEGKFEMSGSSPYMRLSLTIEREAFVCLMESVDIEPRRETYSMRCSPEYDVERDIMDYIQSILLEKCIDILNEIHRKLGVTATETPKRESSMSGDITFIYGSTYTYSNDPKNKLDLHIQHTFDKDPFILLTAEETVKLRVQEPKFYRVSFDTIEFPDPARTYILIDQFKTICTQYIRPFSTAP